VLRVLNLADNSFSGPFPQFLVSQPPQVEAACNGCQVRVSLNGTDNKLQVCRPYVLPPCHNRHFGGGGIGPMLASVCCCACVPAAALLQ
jgi:hypothetical protein